MEVLRELMSLQTEHGFVSDAALREVSRRRHLPLYELEGLVSFYTHFRRAAPPKHVVQVCRDACCQLAGADEFVRDLQAYIADRDDVLIERVSCLGRCDTAPAGSHHGHVCKVPLQDAANFLAGLDHPTSVVESRTAPNWRCCPDPALGLCPTVRHLLDQAEGLAATCINELNASGLQGRGGAGFPTGKKWELVAAEQRFPKYVICNADESEPGTFKDREILRWHPERVIEGMLLAGLTIGATKGVLFLRHEYEAERQIFEAALTTVREQGMLGNNVGGHWQSFDIEIFVSPGGYILGEETALLEALEDKRGEPRNKPPYPGQHGLWGQPTLINNVETFALAAAIIQHGAQWWHDQGQDDYSGLKFVCISGDVVSPGVFEVAMGTSFRDVLNMAGGVTDGKLVHAFLPGGASSRFMTADQLDTPIDFQAVQSAGSMLGTGAIIIFREGRDLLQVATSLTRFFRNESCGKCVPCRLGTEQAVRILESRGARPLSVDQRTLLGELDETLRQTSICGLGQVSLTPLRSLLNSASLSPSTSPPSQS
ncbi:MAG: NAD(P)H-dependent oxidoreductase subunit E [Planctomycetaceae bacterium]|nr:NAD(P)H-dependent oxidoreductase subunit E [Planctomycetaceae bacterium]